MATKINEIQRILCDKSNTKQIVYQITLDVLEELKAVMKEITGELFPCLEEDAPKVEIRFSDRGPFEAHLKFAGDTLVVMMHTNVFDFDDNHYMSKSAYVKEDKMREFCGMIQIYNFLSDSLKYNREQDSGYLVGRIFINKDRHFFIEGKRPLSFLYSNIESNIISKEKLRFVIEEAMLFCLNFDLLAPPLDVVNFISVEQKNLMSFSSGIPTNRHLGFRMEMNDEVKS